MRNHYQNLRLWEKRFTGLDREIADMLLEAVAKAAPRYFIDMVEQADFHEPFQMILDRCAENNAAYQSLSDVLYFFESHPAVIADAVSGKFKSNTNPEDIENTALLLINETKQNNYRVIREKPSNRFKEIIMLVHDVHETLVHHPDSNLRDVFFEKFDKHPDPWFAHRSAGELHLFHLASQFGTPSDLRSVQKKLDGVVLPYYFKHLAAFLDERKEEELADYFAKQSHYDLSDSFALMPVLFDFLTVFPFQASGNGEHLESRLGFLNKACKSPYPGGKECLLDEGIRRNVRNNMVQTMEALLSTVSWGAHEQPPVPEDFAKFYEERNRKVRFLPEQTLQQMWDNALLVYDYFSLRVDRTQTIGMMLQLDNKSPAPLNLVYRSYLQAVRPDKVAEPVGRLYPLSRPTPPFSRGKPGDGFDRGYNLPGKT